MKHTILLVGIVALVGCGDDTTPADTGTTDTGMTDTGATDTGAADTGTADTGAADTGAADTGPLPSPGTRLRMAQEEGRMINCACLVENGSFPDLDACFTAMPLASDTVVDCIDAALAGQRGDTIAFNCRTDALQSLNECNAPVSCADLLAVTGDAALCRDAFTAERGACGDLTPTVADAILACTASM